MNSVHSSLISSLYLSEVSSMRAFARRRLDNPDEADDLVSEAFRILSERQDLDEIDNPAAFLMTILQRQINSALRQRYRRKLTPLEEAGTDIPSAPDIAEFYEDKERQALVAKSLENIASPRQRRALRLYSLNFKAGEIAEIETAAGQPATSHQISCVLQGGLANLKSQFRRRGVLPSFLPLPWILRLRHRIATRAQYLAGQFRSIESIAALQFAAFVSIAAIFSPVPPDKAPGRGPLVQETLQGQLEFGLASLTENSVSPAHVPPGSTGESTASPAEGSASPVTDSHPSRLAPIDPLSPGGGPPAHPAVPTAGGLPSEMQPSPMARVSQGEKGQSATVQVTPVDVLEVENVYREPEQAPPLQDQISDVVERPETIPVPECGGLPPICDDDPPPESNP